MRDTAFISHVHSSFQKLFNTRTNSPNNFKDQFLIQSHLSIFSCISCSADIFFPYLFNALFRDRKRGLCRRLTMMIAQSIGIIIAWDRFFYILRRYTAYNLQRAEIY